MAESEFNPEKEKVEDSARMRSNLTMLRVAFEAANSIGQGKTFLFMFTEFAKDVCIQLDLDPDVFTKFLTEEQIQELHSIRSGIILEQRRKICDLEDEIRELKKVRKTKA